MKRAITFVLIASFALVACGSDDNEADAPAQNRTVTLVTHSSFVVSDDVLSEFTAQTGYEVRTAQQGDAGAMVNEAILRKNNPIGDVMFGIDNAFLSRALDEDIFEDYEPAGADTIREGVYTDPDFRVTPVDQGDVCLNYDLTYFGVDGHPAPPTSFESLIDPAYKDLTVVENAATSSPGLAFLLATISQFGEGQNMTWQAYWTKLRENGVRVVNDWTEAYQTDFTAGGGSGDRPIVVSYGSSPPADVVYSELKRDKPRIGVVDTSCFRQFEFAGVLKGAGNVAGAWALIDFMLTKRFQEDMPLSMFVNPVIEGAVLPAEYAKWAVEPKAPYSIDPATIGAEREDWIKEWTDIVVR